MTPPFPNSPSPSWFRRAQWKAVWSKRNGVHYVGDEVIIDLIFSTPAYNTFVPQSNFDTGTNGQVITTSDRGSYSPVDQVGGSPTYSSTHAYGDLSARIPTGANNSLEWNYALNTTQEYYRFYAYFTAYPPGFVRLALGQSYSLGPGADGKLLIDQVTAFTNAIALNQWVRIEGHLDFVAQTHEVELFNDADSTIPTEVKIHTATGATQNSLFRVGALLSSWGSDFWIDNVVANATAYPGPYDPDPPILNPLTYTVRDFFGNAVSQGSFEEGHWWFSPTAPAGGWQPGWYRVYLTGTQSDANFFDSYGATNFCVIESDSNFVAMPVATTVGGYSGEAPDLVMKGVMGLGTSRLIISDAENYAADLANAELELALTQTYWTNTGTPDSARTSREPWCTFPNGGADTPGQLAGVTAVVSALYPDCKYFEGPSNEPAMSAATAAKMADFADAVHAGHADAQAIGPSFVDISNLSGWTDFLDAGGGDSCDGISFHAYNAITNGDMNLGRSTIQVFLDLLASYGLQNKSLWQTESVGGQTAVYRIYHPRRARKALIETLLFEQKRVPRERNNWWYDTSHGFWNVPAWIENGDGSLEPHAVLGRVLAEETWGKPFSQALDFGYYGNAMYLGNVYQGAAGSVVALMAACYMENASVTLTVSNTTGPLTLVDGLGRSSTVTPSQGRVTIQLTDIPMYLELPVGGQARVYSVNNWPPTGPGDSISRFSSTKQIDGVTYSAIADNGWMTDYGAGTGIAPTTFATPPSTVTLLFSSARIQRMLIWCGPTWQSSGTIIDCTVETTVDGSNWTPRKSINKATPSYFTFGTDSTNVGCFLETYWDEQWIFDVLLDVPVTCTGVRLSVTEASYGGEPLSDTTYGTSFGQGAAVQAYRIEEVAVFPELAGNAKRPRKSGRGFMH